jgi:DNA polymerase-3 subunit delta
VNFSIEKAAKKRVILLSGNEEQLRRRALREILEHLGVERDDFDLEYRSADESTPVEWIASAGTAPFMAERRIVVVRSLLRCEADFNMFNLANLPESALLILVADEEPANSDDKSRKMSTLRGKWEKAVAEGGGHVEQFKIDPKAVKENVRAEALKAGKKLSDQAAGTLVEMTGGNISKALDELEKLVTFAGDGDQISEDHVREVVVPSREWNVYKMLDSITAGAAPEALRQLRILVGSQPKPEDAAFSRVLPMMTRTLRLIWQARLCVEAGCPPSNVTDEVRALLPAKPNITGEHPYRHGALMQTARKANLRHLTRCLQILCDTDARLKGALSSFSTMDTLERMVLDMCVVMSPVRSK